MYRLNIQECRRLLKKTKPLSFFINQRRQLKDNYMLSNDNFRAPLKEKDIEAMR